MTFDEIVSEVMLRLNLTSTDAQARVGQRVNSIYKRVTSSIGLVTSRRVLVTKEVDTANDTGLPYVTIDGIEKVLKITLDEDDTVKLLTELTVDEITNLATESASPTAYAVYKMGPGLVVIVLDAFPDDDDTLTLLVDGYDVADTLSDDSEPYLPTDFHDILVEGALADELRKMEKPQLAVMAEQKYESRLSDLRMFIMKSAYLDIMQGKFQSRNTTWLNGSSLWWNR